MLFSYTFSFSSSMLSKCFSRNSTPDSFKNYFSLPNLFTSSTTLAICIIVNGLCHSRKLRSVGPWKNQAPRQTVPTMGEMFRQRAWPCSKRVFCRSQALWSGSSTSRIIRFMLWHIRYWHLLKCRPNYSASYRQASLLVEKARIKGLFCVVSLKEFSIFLFILI